jgi:hypothetical protein
MNCRPHICWLELGDLHALRRVIEARRQLGIQIDSLEGQLFDMLLCEVRGDRKCTAERE